MVVFLQAAARELEMVKMCRYGAGLKIRSHEDQLREAADIHMKMGNVMQYCELMIKIGQVRFCFSYTKFTR